MKGCGGLHKFEKFTYIPPFFVLTDIYGSCKCLYVSVSVCVFVLYTQQVLFVSILFRKQKNLIDEFNQIQNNGKPSYSFISNKTTMVKENEEVDITIDLSEEQKKELLASLFED